MILKMRSASLPVSAMTGVSPSHLRCQETCLDSKSKERRVVTLFPLRRLLFRSILLPRLMTRVPPHILATVVTRHTRTYGS